MTRFLILMMGFLALFTGCKTAPPAPSSETVKAVAKLDPALKQKYVKVKLSTDTAALSENQRKMIPLLIDAAEIMDELFWLQGFGPKEPFLNKIEDPDLRWFANLNYGPWDRLGGNKPFMEGFGPKPAGAAFYPHDVTKEEVGQAEDAAVRALYTMVRRGPDGKLVAEKYSDAFRPQLEKAASKLREAAAFAEDEGFRTYLKKRADALLSNEYYESDLAWMDMKDNNTDLVIGPIEVYEDELFNYKAAFEAYVLIKDMEWSKRLAHFASVLPALQRGIPVAEKYKKEKPGSDSDLNAYDVVYYAGHSNSGSKTIAINLPNDEKVQEAKGSRRLQLKNAMRAKFDAIMVPISDQLIDPAQRNHVNFEAFFNNTMFHEVAHGLGIKNTIDGKGTVAHALKEQSSWVEEGKADILGLYMISELMKKGELQGDINDSYVTFMAGIFRSIRFGASSAHGNANLVRFNFFEDMGAFSLDEATGFYHVNLEKMPEAVAALSAKLLTLQGDGDYEGVLKLLNEKGVKTPNLEKALARLDAANIPVDVDFEQGKAVLGL